MAKTNTINPLAGILSGANTGVGTSNTKKTSSPVATSTPSSLDVDSLKYLSAVRPNTTATMQSTLSSSPTGVISSGNPVQRQNTDQINSYSAFDMNELLAALQRQNQDFLNSQRQQQSDIEARINALNEAKKSQAISDLGKARDTQLSNLTAEETGIKPAYYDKRNATAATNIMGRRTLAEELAARGEARSGVADQANINANMSLQGETGLLNRQEAADIADIARRRSGIQNAYESDVASTKAGLDAATMENLINQYNTDKQYKLQEAALTGTYNGNQTLDALNAARNYELNEAGLTGSYNGSPTLAAQNQTFNQNMTTQQYNQAVKQQKLDNLYRQQTFDYQKSRDAASDSQWQQQMNLNLRQQSFTEAQQKISNALSQQRITQDEAAQALQWAKFNAEQDPSSIDNQLKRQQIDINAQSKLSNQVNSIIDNYNNLYSTRKYDQTTGETTVTANKTSILDALKASVQSGKMSEDIADQVAGYYGIVLPRK